jgi:ArsR family transcriptional regulator, arsenate/arsenite/antimonite-responsive transcriptional repressor
MRPDHIALARVFHALSDTTRLELVSHLRASPKCVCDLETAVGLRQSLVSFHLRVLKDAGLVRQARKGRWMYYSLIRERLVPLDAVLDHDSSVSDDQRSGRSVP